MTDFLGWLGRPAELGQRESAWTMLRDHAFEGSARALIRSPALIARAADLAGGVAGESGHVSVAFIGAPRWLAAGASGQKVDVPTMAARFRDVGPALVSDLGGAFAIAIYDNESARGVLAIDRMGVQPLFLLERSGSIVFATAPAWPLRLAGEQPSLSSQAVFDYLHGHVVPAPRSIYNGVRRLLPGECVDIEGMQISSRRYWQPRFVEDVQRPFEDLRRDFLAALEAGVGTAMDGARCGAFLSGGTDSSTIAGMMTRLAASPAETFSIGFSAAGFDEMEYARLASKHFGTRHHEYYVTPNDIVAAVPKIAAIHAQPFGNSSALPTYYCARLAGEHGIERLLGGDGGDELFGGNARYGKQTVFAQYERIPAWMRRSLVEPACDALSRRGRIPVVGKAVSYVQQARVPMPERLETYNLLNRIGIAHMLSGPMLAQLDLDEPTRLNREAYLNPSARSLINRMLALDFKTTLADNDLPKVVRSCALAGLPVRFPMLDERVVDFSLSLAPSMKLKGTQLRYFFKQALRDFLPEAIIRKSKHGFGLPFGQWAMQDRSLRDLTFDSLNSLKRRELLQATFIDRLTAELLPSHPDYYGAMAWVLMMLELWLQHHHDPFISAKPAASAHAQPA